MYTLFFVTCHIDGLYACFETLKCCLRYS